MGSLCQALSLNPITRKEREITTLRSAQKIPLTLHMPWNVFSEMTGLTLPPFFKETPFDR
jgi:hypothetical protein